MRTVYKNLCPATISASIMAANMRENSLKNVESDNNKILYETLLDFFLQRNGTWCTYERVTERIAKGNKAYYANEKKTKKFKIPKEKHEN